MKALTLWQPWAGAMALGLKMIETRSWRMEYRGPMAIHASMRKMTEDDWLCVPYETRRVAREAALAMMGLRGGILAVVDVYDCVPTLGLIAPGKEFLDRMPDLHLTDDEYDLGDYSPGRYGILTRNLRVLRHPVPCKGMQGLWIVPDDVAALVLAEIL
jgi:hypothetical protein